MTRALRELNDLSTREAALEYAARGWHVLPLWWVLDEVDDKGEHVCACPLGRECTNQGKHPRIGNGHHAASDDPEQVREWWRQWPQANIGVNCQRSGFFALDVDAGKIMPDEWPGFASTEATPPQTLVQLTGRTDSPGHHVLYSTAKLNGLRVRGHVRAPGTIGVDKILIKHNGLIVVSPSRHKSGRRYQWITDHAPADPGPVITPLVTTQQREEGPQDSDRDDEMTYGRATSFSEFVQAAVNEVNDGKARAEAGSDLACQLRDCGCSPRDAEVVWLPAFYNEVRGIRPNPPDSGIIQRWVELMRSPARDPLPAFDPNVRRLQRQLRAQGENGGADGGEPLQVREILGRENLETLTTDLGNTTRFTRLAANEVLYVADEDRWLTWDGHRWAPDIKNRAMDLTKLVIDELHDAAERADDNRAAQALARWAATSEGLNRRQAMVKGAQSEPSLVITAADLNRDPWLMTVLNGTLDLRSSELRESRREDLITRMAAVPYDPTATNELWRGHVKFLVHDDVELAAAIWRAAGYTLTGLVTERAFFFLEGSGANGKNAFIEPIMAVMGDYATVANEGLLVGGYEQHPTALADLHGTRLVFVDETRQGKPLNVERLKALTGNATLKARRMRQDFFEFPITFKLWIAGNGRPTVADPTDALWDRMQYVVCRGRVGVDVPLVKDYADKLFVEEGPGILNWLVGGCEQWVVRHGIHLPSGAVEDIKEWRWEENPVVQFIEDQLDRTNDADDFLSIAELHRAWTFWALDQGLSNSQIGISVHLSRRLVNEGLVKCRPTINGKQVRGFKGVRFKSQ